MIPAADTRLHAVDAPGGKPAVLLLCVGFGTVQNWRRVMRLLRGKYRRCGSAIRAA